MRRSRSPRVIGQTVIPAFIVSCKAKGVAQTHPEKSTECDEKSEVGEPQRPDPKREKRQVSS